MEKMLLLAKKIIPRRLFKKAQPLYHFILSFLASLIYRFPSEKLIIIGVTGTTGKTTSVVLIAEVLKNAGIKAGFTSTALFNDGKKEWLNDKKMTMVGRFFTQKMIRNMANNGCQAAIVETTSEGIKQFRHRFINYDILVFTGLYEEHIDSHGSFENYKKAKGELFRHLRNCRIKYAGDDFSVVKTQSNLKKLELRHIKKTIIANGDDKHKDYFLNFWAEQKVMYKKNQADKESENLRVIGYSKMEAEAPGVSFKFSGAAVKLHLLGSFNVLNAMNAVAVASSLGINRQKIKNGLENIKGVPGRLERIDEGQEFIVIVDYAFEPNALAKLYDTIEGIPHNKVIHVLGSAGGGRDLSRRPKLGGIAGEKADFVIVTNEDPYDDDPDIIIDQVSLGAEKAGKTKDKNLFKIADRRLAVKKAFALAKKNDLVIITGKGSEQAICAANGEKITWDDRAVARSLLKNK